MTALCELCGKPHDGTCLDAALVAQDPAAPVHRLFYAEWSAQPGADLDDVSEWARANPALGDRVQVEDMAAERQMMIANPEAFGLELMGLVPNVLAGGVFTEEQWKDLEDEHSKIVGPVAWSIDVTPDRSRTCITAAGWRADLDLHVEVVDHEPGTAWVIPRMLKLVQNLIEAEGPDVEYAFVIAPNSPAGSLIKGAEEAGLEILKPTGPDYSQACNAFYDDVDNANLRHLGTSELRDAVTGCRKKDNAEGAWSWDRRHAGVDISPLCSATLASWGLHQLPEPTGDPEFFSWADIEELAADEKPTPRIDTGDPG